VLLATVDDFDFAFEATTFLLMWALACFETDLAAGSADALAPMQSQAMHASNGRVLAQKRLIRRPYRFCDPVQTIQDAPHRPKGSRDDASDFRRPVSNNVVKNPAEK
jgi:hypothetical protein